MNPPKIRRALIAVYDKTGIVDFARALHDEFGIEIISTGGTAKVLKDAGVSVTLVEQVTGFPEMLDGRVKTLHPKIHAAILADRDNPDHMRQLKEHGIEPIDMVVVNLYPFEKTIADPHCKFEEAIEMIDIGGPCLLRAAAKNHRHVLVVCHGDSYSRVLYALRDKDDSVLSSLRLGDESTCCRFSDFRIGALPAFDTTFRYDAQVAMWLSSKASADGKPFIRQIDGLVVDRTRYGENPHQTAEVLQIVGDDLDITVADAGFCDGQPEPSYNNFVDADAALMLCAELNRANHSSCCVFIKHTNACGVGVGNDPIDAYRRAYLGDPNAAMGGILAVNFEVTAEFADAVMKSLDRWGKQAGAGAFFMEVWVAPAFSDDAIKTIRQLKKWGANVRLFEVDTSQSVPSNAMQCRSISGGMLVQTRDTLGLNESQWKVVTQRPPTDAELADLRLAWLIAKHTKSNAISICKDGMLIGNGAGQMSRVMSCRIATWLANENGHADKLKGSAAASDAFFPFRDGPDILINAGATALIQPGGSKRDEETIKACDERGVAMIFTGTRHFKH